MDVAGVGRRDSVPYPRVSWPSSLEGLVRSLEQPQRLGLLLVCPFLGGRSLRRPLLTPTPGRASGSDVSRIPGFVFPLGSRPFDHRQGLLRQPGQVPVVERPDVRVRRGPLHPEGSPAPFDGHDDLQVLRQRGLLLGVIRTLWVLFGLPVGVLLIDNRSSRVVCRIPTGPS